MGLGSSEAWQTHRSGRICRRLRKPELSWRDHRWAALFLLMLVACLHGQAEVPDAIQSRLNTERHEISADPPFGLPSELRHQSRSHRFWNRSNLMLNGANLVAQGLDYWTTRKLLRRDYREGQSLGSTVCGQRRCDGGSQVRPQLWRYGRRLLFLASNRPPPLGALGDNVCAGDNSSRSWLELQVRLLGRTPHGGPSAAKCFQ